MEWLFLVVSLVAVVAAGMMLTRRNAVHSALFLIVNFGCVAFLYLMLDAPFLAMVQVTVYTGAIMVLFLFVIMLLGAEATSDTTGQMRWLGFAGTAVAILILLIFGFPIASNMLGDETVEPLDATAQLRLINAIPANPGQTFLLADAELICADESISTLQSSLGVSVLLAASVGNAPDVLLGDVVYNDPRDELRGYQELPAADYSVRATVGDGNCVSTPILAEEIAFAADSAQTIVAFENADGFVDIRNLEDDISEPGVGEMRLTVFNAVTDATISLVDLGQYTAIRTLCDDSACDTLLPHRRLIDELPAGGSVSIELDEGDYNLAFVDSEQNVLRTLAEYKAERGIVETRVFAREPGPPGSQASYRANVFNALGAPSFGGPEAIGQVLFIDYVLPVQLVGMLLLVALIGVIVLARPDALRQAERRRVNQRRRVSRPLVSVISQQTGSDVLGGQYLAKLPGGSDDPDAE